jgi:exonuclease SbcD
MKFIHLSDLHVGKSVNGFSMLEEQRRAFDQIIAYIETERPAAALIAGDVYDRAVPGVEAVCLFDDFITRLAKTGTAVFIVSGNHDSPERIGYASRLLSEKNIFLCGVFDKAPQKIVLTDEYGEVFFWLLPFIKPSSLYGMFGDKKIEGYNEALSAAIESANVDFSSRNVLVSHQFYTKAGHSPLRSESELEFVGGLDAVDSAIIELFDYAALGHLHRAQKIGSEHIRYAGSPVKYSFSECRQEKSFTAVELREKGDLSITAVPLKPIHDMREIKGDLASLTSAEVSSLADKEDYLRVILTDEEEIVDPMGKIRGVYPNVMALGFENSRTGAEIPDIPDISKITEQPGQLGPYELFGEFFFAAEGSVMTKEQSGIVRDILDSVIDAEDGR